MQVQNGVDRVIAYASRSLRKHERNYSATELECSAVVFGIERFRPYIYGRHFQIVTDHCALCYLLKLKDPNGKLARMALKLQAYDFEIVYRSGSRHMDVDSLSRNPVDPPPESDADPLNLDECLNELGANQEFANFAELQEADPRLKKIRDALLAKCSSNSTDDDDDDYALKNNILYKSNNTEHGRLWLLCVPIGHRRKIMESVHVTNAGHLGLFKTWLLIKNRFYWPKMYSHVKRFVQGCNQCQFHNHRTTLQAGPMQLVPPPKIPFYRIGIDFQGPYPVSQNRNTFVLVIVDHTTRYVEAFPVPKATSKVTMKILEQNIILRHGCPKEILCDRGSSFTSQEFRDFCESYHIKLLFTTAYHPNTNGICERANGTIKRILAKHVSENHRDWDKFVSKAAHAINIAVNSTTKASPYFLLYGREIFLPCDARYPTIEDELGDSDVGEKQKAALENAYYNTVEAQKVSKDRFDKKHKNIQFNPNDLVLIANHARVVGRVTKWLKKWIGPFRIVESRGPINYLVEDLREGRTGRFMNVSIRRMKSYREAEISDSTIATSEDEILSTLESESSDDNYLAPSISFKSRRTQKSRTIVPESPVAANSVVNSPVAGPSAVANSVVNNNAAGSVSFNIPGNLTVTVANSSVSPSVVNQSLDSSQSNSELDISRVTVRRSSRSRNPVSRYGSYDIPKSYISKAKSKRK